MAVGAVASMMLFWARTTAVETARMPPQIDHLHGGKRPLGGPPGQVEQREAAARGVVPGLEGRCGRPENRHRADAQREHRQPDERGQNAPDDEEDADEVDVGGHGGKKCGGQAAGRIATRTSTRTDPTCGERSRNRNVAPSATRAGSITRTGCRNNESPVPRQ